MKKFSVTLAISLLALSTSTFANSQPHMIIAPTCLVQSLAFKPLATQNAYVLLATDEQGIEQLITAKEDKTKHCGGFMDVTDAWNTYQTQSLDAARFLQQETAVTTTPAMLAPYKVQHQKEVAALIAEVNPQNIWDNLTTFSQFDDRYANNANGTKAANWIKSKVETIAKDNGRTDITTFFVSTHGYTQPSLVVKIGTSTEPGIVVGAHMDTVKSDWYSGKKPGADDDGSGSMTTLESFRALVASGLTFEKPIYFIWYAAEEDGLYGSQAVVQYFKKNNIAVSEVIQIDMTGFEYKNDPTIWFMTDYVNKDLTTFLETLVTTYVKEPVKESHCGYGCSDHVSWNNAGIRAAMPAEAAYEDTNPSMHSSDDTIEKLTLAHMSDFAKLGLAFVGELA